MVSAGAESPNIERPMAIAASAGRYRPLVLQPAAPDSRDRLLDFAEIPDRHRSKYPCLTLPTEDDGFIVCGVAAPFCRPAPTVRRDRG